MKSIIIVSFCFTYFQRYNWIDSAPGADDTVSDGMCISESIHTSWSGPRYIALLFYVIAI